MFEFIDEWADQVNTRKDLLPSWRERNLNVILQTGQQSMFMVIDPTGVKVKHSIPENFHILLNTSTSMMKDIFSGKEKLTALPESNITITGAYQNILFMEALLLLSK